MATHEASDLNGRVALANGPYGNCAVHVGKVVPASSPSTADVLRLLRIPAGTRIDELIIINDDLESSTTTMQCKVGYTPCNSADGPTADDDYFFTTGQTFLQGAARTVSTAKPIVFEYDVFVDLTVTAIAGSYKSTTGEVHAIARGEIIGTD